MQEMSTMTTIISYIYSVGFSFMLARLWKEIQVNMTQVKLNLSSFEHWASSRAFQVDLSINIEGTPRSKCFRNSVLEAYDDISHCNVCL